MKERCSCQIIRNGEIMKINLLFSKLNFDEEWAKISLERFIKGNERVVVLPFSYWDEEIYDISSWENAYTLGGKYFEEIYKPFSSYGFLREQFVYINYFLDDKKTIEALISRADILFLTGGAPDLFMERILKKDIMQCIKDFKGLVIGCSAGSMIQFRKFHITPGKLYPSYKVVEGIGMIDMNMGIEVHYEASCNQIESIHKANKENNSFLLLDNESGALIINDKLILLGNAKLKEGKDVI